MDHFKHRRTGVVARSMLQGMVINSAVRKCKLLNIHITHQKDAERIATLVALFSLLPYIIIAKT